MAPDGAMKGISLGRPQETGSAVIAMIWRSFSLWKIHEKGNLYFCFDGCLSKSQDMKIGGR